jgi:hypothetical protein
MNENEPLKQETRDVGESITARNNEVLGAVATGDTIGPRAGSRRGASFSWFRLVVAVTVLGMLLMTVAPYVPGLRTSWKRNLLRGSTVSSV